MRNLLELPSNLGRARQQPRRLFSCIYRRILYTFLLVSIDSKALSAKDFGEVEYQPKGWRGGYEDYVIDPSQRTFGVRVFGNIYTKMHRLQEYARRRALELCIGRSFTVQENSVECTSRVLFISPWCEQEVVHIKIRCQ